jgi:hypothetical protein
MIHGVIHLSISLAGDFPVLMEAREYEFNVTALLGLKTTGFGRPFMLVLTVVVTSTVFYKLFVYHCIALHPESNRTLTFGFL